MNNLISIQPADVHHRFCNGDYGGELDHEGPYFEIQIKNGYSINVTVLCGDCLGDLADKINAALYVSDEQFEKGVDEGFEQFAQDLRKRHNI